MHGPRASFSRQILVGRPSCGEEPQAPGVEVSPPSRSKAPAGTSPQPTACPHLAGLRDSQLLTQTAQAAGCHCTAPGPCWYL